MFSVFRVDGRWAVAIDTQEVGHRVSTTRTLIVSEEKKSAPDGMLSLTWKPFQHVLDGEMCL